MRTVALFEMLFGLLVLVLGIIGIASGGEALAFAISLVAGLVLLGSGLTMQKGSRRSVVIALIVSVALGGYYGYQSARAAWHIYPEGCIAALGVVSVILLGILLVQPRQRERIF